MGNIHQKKGGYFFDPEKLRKLRRMNDDTIVGLAESIGVSPTAVALWEKRGRLNVKNLARLCDHYKVDPGFFFSGETHACVQLIR